MLTKFVFRTLILSAMIFSVITISNVSADNHKNKNSDEDIVATAVETGKFNTLAKALAEAGLVEALQGSGPFTVFAPTDDAFAKLPESTIEALLKDKEALKSVLLYHVVSGNVTSNEVIKLDKAETLSGKNLNIKVMEGSVMINDSKVITADVMASNGVIHIIDTVLIPE
jgi:uncharacterized surface protein with fasciclin (FAS1) repeats